MYMYSTYINFLEELIVQYCHLSCNVLRREVSHCKLAAGMEETRKERENGKGVKLPSDIPVVAQTRVMSSLTLT